MKVGLFYDGQHLIPADEEEAEKVRNGYTRGEIVEVDVKKARHWKHHKLHFARFREVVKRGCKVEGTRFHSEPALRAFVYIRVGWCDWFEIGGESIPIARTINWDAVDQTLFKRIDEQAVLFLADEMVPSIDSITEEAAELRERGADREDLREAA